MKNDPNKNGMIYASHALPSLHLFTFFKHFVILLIYVFCWNMYVLISYTGGVCCGCWRQASTRWQSSESFCWMKRSGKLVLDEA